MNDLPDKKGCSVWPWVAVGLLILIAAAVIIPGLLSASRAPSERNASASLKTLTSASADFRANDRDNNKENDFWVADVAGLYHLIPPGGPPEPIKLIEVSVACADSAPRTGVGKTTYSPWAGNCGPKAGYHYRALRFYVEKGKTVPYDSGNGRNPSRFGFIAYPWKAGAGKYMFIVNEENTLYKKPWTGFSVDSFPEDLAAEGWTKLD